MIQNYRISNSIFLVQRMGVLWDVKRFNIRIASDHSLGSIMVLRFFFHYVVSIASKNDHRIWLKILKSHPTQLFDEIFGEP